MTNKALVCQLLQRLLAFSKFYFFFVVKDLQLDKVHTSLTIAWRA